MQNLSNLEITPSNEKTKMLNNGDIIPDDYDGILLAKIFKYCCHMHNINNRKMIPFKLINGKAIYKKNKNAFDKFSIIVKKNKFNVKKYFEYCVVHGIKEDNVNLCISSSLMIEKYKDHLKKIELYKKIYKWILKTVKNIVVECIDKDIYTTKEYLRWLINNNMIGKYLISGKISIYYLAAIPNFKDIIHKLDYFSQQELHRLSECFDIYHSDVNKAFLQEKNEKFNPIDYTDFAIFSYRKKMNEQTNRNNSNI